MTRWLLAWFGVVVLVKPAQWMRYPTAGDWQVDSKGIMVSVVDTGHWRYTVLLAAHEIVEAWLCRRHGISQVRVDHFDIVEWPRIKWRYRGSEEPAIVNDEPGDWNGAPYHREHLVASLIERWLARLLWVDWDQYEAAVDSALRERGLP